MQTSPPRSRSAFYPAWLAAALMLLLLIMVRLFTGFNGLYGQDGFEYLRYARDVFSVKGGGSFYWPVVYPVMAALPGYLTGHHDIILQAISMLSLAGILLFTAALLLQTFPDQRNLISIAVFLIVGLSPYMFRTSLQVMADALSIFFVMGGAFFVWRYKARPTLLPLLGAMLFAGLATGTRYGCALLFVYPSIVLLLVAWKSKKWLHLFIMPLAAFAGFLPQLLLRGAAPAGFLDHPWLTTWSPLHFIHSAFDTPDGHQQYPVPNLVYIFSPFIHPGFILAGPVFLIAMLLRRKWLASPVVTFAFLTILPYLIFMGGMPIQNARFLLPLVPFVMILFFPLLRGVTDWFMAGRAGRRWLFGTLAVLFVLIQAGLGVRALLPSWHMQQKEKEMVALVRQHPDATVYAMGMTNTIQYYGASNTVVDVFNQEVRFPQPGDLCIFRYAVWSGQFQGLRPMQNWNHIDSLFTLEPIADYGDDWKIYEVR